jgi:hypothetical protein
MQQQPASPQQPQKGRGVLVDKYLIQAMYHYFPAYKNNLKLWFQQIQVRGAAAA